MGDLLYFPRMPQDRPEKAETAPTPYPAPAVAYKPSVTFPEGFLEGTQRLANMLAGSVID